MSKLAFLKAIKLYWLILFVYLALPLFFNLYLTEHTHLIKRSIYLGICTFGLMLPWFICPRLSRLWILFSIPLYIIYWAGCCHALIFHVPLNSSSVLVILDSNPEEAKEFYNTFVKPSIIITSLVLLFGGVFGFLYLVIAQPEKALNKKLIILGIIACIFAWSKQFHSTIFHRYQLLPYRVAQGIKEYNLIRDEILKLKQTHTIPKFPSIKSKYATTYPQTYIIVIGESANKDHLSWYGYERDTTPYTQKFPKPYIFQNIHSPHALTMPSLRKVLTFAHDDQVMEGLGKGSIINIFNAAGFKTFWISNQLSQSKFDNLVGMLGKDAKEAIFINDYNDYLTTITKGNTVDEKLLPHIQKALEDKAPRKVIFVHLMGSHSPYDWRLPQGAQHFSLNSPTPAQKFVDIYDDTIRYTDKVIADILAKMLKLKEDSYLLYFSDHGEDISASPDSCRCHNSDEYATPPMYDIPLMLWTNKAYKKSNPNLISRLPHYLDRPFNTQHLIHSIPYLSGISLDEMEPQHNLFSPSFVPEKE